MNITESNGKVLAQKKLSHLTETKMNQELYQMSKFSGA